MVAIGGGGTAAESPEGALLTASYPNDDLSGWLVTSTDHIKPNPHQLIAYAIGMKIEVMSRDQLMKSIFVNTADSGVAGHPEKEIYHPFIDRYTWNRYILIGGGFNVQWVGTLPQPPSRKRYQIHRYGGHVLRTMVLVTQMLQT
jgi:hypothetical protein